jgi:hypothetical protein
MRRLRGHSEDTSMKAFAILAATAAILSFNIAAASSQQACQAEFQACMDYCGARSSKTIQDSCFQSCETKNNMCAERVYGKRPFNGAPATAASQASPAKDALAKKEKDVPAQEPAAAEPAPQPEQAPAPRAPAKR